MHSKLDVSIVIPLFNEAGNVRELISQIIEQVKTLDISFEILLVDDGSHDLTWHKIETASSVHQEVSGLKLSRNFGHQHALLAGLKTAKGQAVISMDGDLQHPPSVLPKLIEQWHAGSKIVYTKRHSPKSISTFKRKTSDMFYGLFSWLSGVPMTQGSSDFRLIDRQVLNELLKFNDVEPFLRGAVRWLGYEHQSSTVEFTIGSRHSGESQYTIKKMITFANSAIVSFSTKPLLVAIWLGLTTSLLAFAELGYILCQYLTGNTVAGWASTVGIVSLLFGILFILLGIIGLYLAQIHTALKQRPKFIIEKSTQIQEDKE